MKKYSDCVFCKIINKELPSHILYESATILVILDAFPTRKGHTLIIPKKHYVNHLDTPENTILEMNIIAKKVIKNMTTNLYATGFNLIANIHRDGGQVVFHHHMHVIPLTPKNPRIYKDKRLLLSTDEMNLICEKLSIN